MQILNLRSRIGLSFKARLGRITQKRIASADQIILSKKLMRKMVSA